jgi:HD-GYP domain-containing protein (c-di-GMP phosphodiesterase class II)
MAASLGLPDIDRDALVAALLLADAGACGLAPQVAALIGSDAPEARAGASHVDWTRAVERSQYAFRRLSAGPPTPGLVWRVVAWHLTGRSGALTLARARAKESARIALRLGAPPRTVSALAAIGERWDGRGVPDGRAGNAIPLLARIAALAEHVERVLSHHGARAAYDVLEARRGRWFDPALVDVLKSHRKDYRLWRSLADGRERGRLADLPLPSDETAPVSADVVALQVADAVDAKSAWTVGHSRHVADIADRLAGRLGLADEARAALRRAAWLHDLGKLGVSSLILDKAAPLLSAEREALRRHPRDTAALVGLVPRFADLAATAAAHHERTDGTGYHLRLDLPALPLAARILAVADVVAALRASRPYRPALSDGWVASVVEREVRAGLDPSCVAEVRHVLAETPAPPSAPAVRTVASLGDDHDQAA